MSLVSRSMSESSWIGVSSKVTVVSAEGALLVSNGAVASFLNFDRCWTVRGMEPSEEKLTVSPGLGLVTLIRCKWVVGTRTGAFIISNFFFPRHLLVGPTSGLVFLGEALGDFLFLRCLEIDCERFVSWRLMMDSLGGGVSGMTNSKPILGFSGVAG